AQQLDFQRFSSDEVLACFEAERAILARVTPTLPVTTNFMGFFKPMDYWRWVRGEDIVSHDSYPDPSDPESTARAAMSGDLMRSLGGGRSWMLMEQTTNRVNWRPRNAAKPPGLMRLWSLQAVARGADAVMFFQWRQSRGGAEKWHSAFVPHGPVEDSPGWQEAKALGAELGRLAAVAGSRVQAEVAVLLDWESWWALELPSKPSTDVRLLDQVWAWYRELFDLGVTADFAHPEADLGAYRLVVAPNLYLMTERSAANLDGYVTGGGHLAVSFFSGLVDAQDRVRPGAYPAALAGPLGLTVTDFAPLAEGETLSIRLADGTRFAADLWSEIIVPGAAEAVGWFEDGIPSPGPAITRHRHGQGVAHYLGTRPDRAGMGRLVGDIVAGAGVRPQVGAPAGVEVVRRVAAGRSLLFLLNHSGEAALVDVAPGARDLLTGSDCSDGRLRLEPLGAAVLSEPEAR
ncbi:MAG: beta-galactosidase, partial [Candidatus Dormibacteraeota bacterium]|nr:beta-galactosidase [Candidatus Dormibacteraeota bacterium]